MAFGMGGNEIAVRLTLNNSGFGRGLAESRADVQKSAGFFRSALSTGVGVVGAGIFTALTAGAVGWGKSLLMANANAEAIRTTLDIATGSAERASMVFATMQKMAAATPFEFAELASGAARIEAFGIDSTKVMDTIGDTAAGTMRSIDQVTNAYLDAGMGQFIRLQELGIDVAANVEGHSDEVRLKWFENGKEIVKFVDKDNAALIQSTVAAIWNSKYEGAMKKQSKTFLGQWSTLKDNFNLTMQAMSKGVFEFVRGGLSEANEFFNLFNTKLAAGIGPVGAALSALHVTMDQVFGKRAGDVIDGTLRGIVGGIGDVVGAGKTLVSIFGAMGGALFLDLAKGDISGFFLDLKDDLEFAANQGIKLGKIVVSAGFKLAQGAVTDLWGWFVGQVMGKQTVYDPMTGFASQVTPPVNFGTVLVTAGVKLAEGIWGGAKDAWSWFEGQIGVGTSGFAGVGAGSPMGESVSLGSVLIDALTDVGGQLKAIKDDASTWIKTAIGWTGDKTVIVGKLIIQGDVQIQDTTGATPEQKSKTFVQKFIDGVQSTAGAIHDAGIWLGKTFFGAAGFGFGAVLGGLVDLGAVAVGGIIAGIKDPGKILNAWEWFSKELYDSFVTIMSTFALPFKWFWGRVGEGFSATAIDFNIGEKIHNAIFGSSNTVALNPFGGGSVTVESTGLIDKVRGWFEDLDFSDIVSPKWPDWMNSDTWLKPFRDTAGFVEDIVKGKNPLKMLDDFLFQGASASGGETSFSTLEPITSSFDNLLNALDEVPGKLQSSMLAIKGALSQLLDGTGLASGIGPGGPSILSQFESINDIRITIPAPDTSGFLTVLTDVQTKANTFGATTYRATFAGDLGPFAIVYSNAFALGQVFDDHTWTGSFALDIGDVVTDYTTAYGLGDAWDNATFSARFSIDTSPMFAALETVRFIAQEMRDLLPSSPAKKGPFSRLPTFRWLADDLMGTLQTVKTATTSGMDDLARSLRPMPAMSLAGGGAGGSGRGDVHVHVHNHGTIIGEKEFVERTAVMVAEGLSEVYSEQQRGHGR